jgi:hypothetical protein
VWNIFARSGRTAVWFALQLAQNGFAEHAEALAVEIARSADSKQFDHWNFKISHLAHLARLASRAGPARIRNFIQCALDSESDNWLAGQYKRCPPGPLAGALLSLWAYLDPETVKLFVQDSLAARLGQLTRRIPSAPIDERSAILQLIGVCNLLAVVPEPTAVPSLDTESIEQILQFATIPDDAEYLGHMQIQLWLGLRWIAQRLTQELRISPDIGNRTLELLRKVEPNTERQRSLQEGMITWMLCCRKNNWTLVRD